MRRTCQSVGSSSHRKPTSTHRRLVPPRRCPYCHRSMTLAQDLQYAIDLARGAGRVVTEHYGKVGRLTKTHAAAQDEAVTEADRESQRFIVKGLRVRYPKDGVI